jgi:hypothetical protein
MKSTVIIIGIFAAQFVAFSSPTAPNSAPALANLFSNNLAFLNTNTTDYASNLAAAYAAYRQGKVSKGVLMILAQRAANAEPQDFYGRVIDQYGQPISTADIAGNLRVMGGLGDGANNQTLKAQSDPDGLFQFTGIKGWRLNVIVRKGGYAISSTKGPSGQKTSPTDRATFTMWKLQGAEPLVGIDKTYKLRYTAAPINFDLLAGQIVPSGGDIQITVNRPAGVISGRNPQNWSIQIEVIDGGFIVTSWGEAQTTYSAPENGYESSGTFGNNNGIDTLDQMFFVQSRNGQVYSKVHLLLGINDTPDGLMYVTFSGVANTNGSRNWEATAPQ